MIVGLIVALSLMVLLLAIWLTGKSKWLSEARVMMAGGMAGTMIVTFYTVFGTGYQIDLMSWYGAEQHLLYAMSWYPAYLLGIICAGFIRSTGPHITLPDRFRQYGTVPEIISSVVSMIYCFSMDTVFILGILGSMLFAYEIGIEIFMIILGGFMVWFSAKKGWITYSLGGMIMFAFMAIGVGVGSLQLVEVAGGWDVVRQLVPESHLTPWFGDVQGYISLLAQPANLFWFMTGFTFFFDPMVWQRISFTESGSAARKGLAAAMLFWVVFDVATLYSGIAVAALGNMHYPGEVVYYLDIAYEFLPGGWAGLVIAGNLMAALAGGSAYLHAGGTMFAQNLATTLGWLSESALSRDREAQQWREIGIWILGALTILLALGLYMWNPGDPTTTAWVVISGLLVGTLGVPTILGGLFFRDSASPKAVSYSMMAGFIVSLAAILGGFIFPTYSGGITFGIIAETASATPLLDASRALGLIASAIGYIIGTLLEVISR